MADKAPDHQKYNTHNTSPSEVYHSDTEKFRTKNIAYKMADEKTRHGNQDINKDREDISAQDHVSNTPVKSCSKNDKKDRLNRHSTNIVLLLKNLYPVL